jgi:Fuc2NAc and GlcNAc transferase
LLSVNTVQGLLVLFPRSLTLVLLATLTSWLLLHWLIPVLRRRLPDAPNARSAHQQVTPRGGGIVFVLVSALASLALGSAIGGIAWLPLLALPLALMGLVDDRFSLPALVRLVVQVATSIVLLLLSMSGGFWSLPMLLIPVVLLSIVSVINFTNFMDGLDGLVAGCMAVALAAAALQLAAPLPIWALVGSLLGFLIWNWSPAKVFMGDVGSTFLGAVFAGLALQAPSWPEALALLLVATPLLGDAFLCVPRRLLAGQRVFQAHRLHLFQRLHQAGWPHGRVSSLYVAATAVLAMALLTGGLPWVLALAALELLLGVWLDQRVAVPFAVASRN